MSGTLLVVGPALGIAMLILTGVAAAVSLLGHLGHSRAIGVAVIRAVLQLGVVSVLIAAIVAAIWWVALFVLVMYVVASWTAGRRLTRGPGSWWALVPVGLGCFPIVAGLLLTGLLPSVGIAVIPIAGILLGGAMSATSLAGRRALDELGQRYGEYEAALAIGMSERAAALEICRPAAGQALMPPLDQTRTVGLVTLPGAFVGMLLGGATPVHAGAVQLFVLIALLAVESIAIVTTVELVARGIVRRQNPRS